MIQIRETSDGSQTLFSEELNETYHSTHGAVQESMHVFIENGYKLKSKEKNHIHILEIGFGTGLNALLCLRETGINPELKIDYLSLEPFPISEAIYSQLHYGNALEQEQFLQMHQVESGKKIDLNNQFSFTRLEIGIEEFISEPTFDLVFYDAFGPPTQPELWTTDIIKRSTSVLVENGIWVSYCAKGDVRRSLISLGLEVKRIPGPPGKRHMLFAQKVKV